MRLYAYGSGIVAVLRVPPFQIPSHLIKAAAGVKTVFELVDSAAANGQRAAPVPTLVAPVA